MELKKERQATLFDAFKKMKRQGNTRRTLKNQVNSLLKPCSQSIVRSLKKNCELVKNGIVNCPSEVLNNCASMNTVSGPINQSDDYLTHDWIFAEEENECNREGDPQRDSASTVWTDIQTNFRTKLSERAIINKPTHRQLRNLLSICNETLPIQLPVAPRTILGTTRVISTTKFHDGSEYWHHSLINSLNTILCSLVDVPDSISLNINIDGLPLFESSLEQFWPILCNIQQLHYIEPIVIGIYCGKSVLTFIYSNQYFK